MGNYRLGMEMNEGYGTYLAHHGIKGQKWGVRRFQNPDGTLTAAGKERYLNSETSESNFRKINEAHSREAGGDMPVHKKAEQKHMDVLDSLRDSAADLSGARKDADERNKALATRNQNINPFKSKSLQKKYLEADAKASQSFNNFTKMYSDMGMDYIQSMPKDQREDAMRYVAFMIYGE